jgi:nucleoid-associated protein YgaU
MISTNSRYKDSQVDKVNGPGGALIQAIIPSAQRGWVFNFTYHSIAAGDRPDLLATRFYGDPTQWWHIADANPEILDWVSVAPGTVIRVPNV